MSTSKSPVKSISVREDGDGKRALHIKQKEKRYKSVANFHFSVVSFVDFPPKFRRYNGYLIDVHRVDGANMKCFVTCEEMSSVKGFTAGINRVFSSQGGVMWEKINDYQLRQYLMSELERFHEQPEGAQKRMKAAITIGRQPGSNIYVFDTGVELNGGGFLVNENEAQYVFMPPYMNGMNIPVGDQLLKECLRCSPVNLEVPLLHFDWRSFMQKSKDFMKDNFLQFVMFLAGGLSAFHYQRILDVVGSCPAPLAVGETASGKSTCLRLIQCLLGGVFLSQSSAESVATELVRSTLPVYWDDPAHPKTLKKVLVSTFQGGGKQTKTSGNELPLTTFLITVNFTLDDDMRSFERSTPIFFEKIVSNENSADFFERRREVFNEASTTCIPSVIRMDTGITDSNLEGHLDFFRNRMKGLPFRLPNIYSVYRYFAFEVIELVNDDSVISKGSFDEHLEKRLLPYVLQQYGKTRKVALATVDSFLSDVVAAVDKGNLVAEASKWLKPNVKQRSGQRDIGTLHLARHPLCAILSSACTPYTLEDIRKLCAKVEGANSDFRSHFGKPTQEMAIKLPREAVNAKILAIIDSWFEKCKDDTGKKLEDASKEIIEIEEQLPCERCTELENRIKQLQERIAFMEDIHQKEVDNINRRLMSVEEERRQLEAESYDIRKERDKLRDELNTFRGNSSALGHTPPVVRSLQSVLSVAGIETPDRDGQGEPKRSGVTGVKRKAGDSLSLCNLCSSKKKSSMVMCAECMQWQHFKCAGVTIVNYSGQFSCGNCRKK